MLPRARLSRAEQKAIKRLRDASAAKDYPAAAVALQSAKQAVKFKEGRYLVSVLQLQLGTETGNTALRMEAIDAALGTGLAPKAASADLSALRARLATVPAPTK
ncbi:MAG TPA: hypothetical protein VF631_02380 [Allosphingosinicella sp.]|jgi:hypothetical protein|uniref:hypothetical protein n=1 Tax=Allosphingosinicella sp. TaxID=2823234 RepID=UPI002F2AA300